MGSFISVDRLAELLNNFVINCHICIFFQLFGVNCIVFHFTRLPDDGFHEATLFFTSHTAVVNGIPVVKQDKSDVTEPASDWGRVTVTFAGLRSVTSLHLKADK